MTREENVRSVKGEWPAEAIKAFETLRSALQCKPILQHPNWDLPFEIHTDASGVGLGAILVQQQLTDEVVVAYASRVLRDAETRYSAYEKEFLAIVWALENFRYFIAGTKVIIRTDCEALARIDKKEAPESKRVFRWILRMSEFDYEITTVKGIGNANADALSRAPLQVDFASEDARDDGGIRPFLAIEEDVDIIREENDEESIPSSTTNECDGPHNYTGPTTLPSVEDWILFQAQDEHLQARKRKYGLRKGVLVRSVQRGDTVVTQVVVPKESRKRVLYYFHGSPITAHCGTPKCYHALKKYFWWKHMRRDIKQWVRSCLLCAKRKLTRQVNRGKMGQVMQTKPMETVFIDFVGPLPVTESGTQYILTMLDSFTRFPWAIPLPSRSSDAVAAAIFDNLISLFGLPRMIFSDRAPEFKASLKQLCQKLGIAKAETTGYNPQANGQVERFHRFMNETLSVLAKSEPTQWDRHLTTVLFAYRTTLQRSTGFTPYELMFGREPHMPADVLFNDEEGAAVNANTYAEMVTTRLRQWCRAARARQDRIRKEYILKPRQANVVYAAGDWVLFWTPGTSEGIPKKLSERWTGPFRTVGMQGQIHCLVTMNGKLVKTNINRLRRYEPFLMDEDEDQHQPNGKAGPRTHWMDKPGPGPGPDRGPDRTGPDQDRTRTGPGPGMSEHRVVLLLNAGASLLLKRGVIRRERWRGIRPTH